MWDNNFSLYRAKQILLSPLKKNSSKPKKKETTQEERHRTSGEKEEL